MNEFMISERYRLELHWSKALYLRDGIIVINNAFFSGPVLHDISSIQGNDSINMDFGKQYSRLISSYYIVKLEWGNIHISSDKIRLFDVVMKNLYINSIPRLRDSDYIVIDTSDHEVNVHHKNLNYRSYLLKNDGSLYNFGGK